MCRTRGKVTWGCGGGDSIEGAEGVDGGGGPIGY